MDNNVIISPTLSINQNGGAYKNGRAYDVVKKLDVTVVYETLCQANGGVSVSRRQLGKAAGIGASTAAKIIHEIENGGVQEPISRSGSKGRKLENAGIKSLSMDDELLLVQQHVRNPCTTIYQYKQLLFEQHGTTISKKTLSLWWRNRFPYAATLRKPNVIPVDKYRPENWLRYLEYIDIMRIINPAKLKFGDEKHLKGGELYTTCGRRCPFTGEVPAVTVASDFRNTYSLTGFCGIDSSVPACYVIIHQLINDSSTFAEAVEELIVVGWLKRGDVLVLDNAAIHVGGENVDLRDWLLNSPHPDGQPMGIFLLLLPARTPELNPEELVWHSMVKKMRMIPGILLPAAHAAAYAAAVALGAISHIEVMKMYMHCGYLPK
jgi:hypothetical protein